MTKPQFLIISILCCAVGGLLFFGQKSKKAEELPVGRTALTTEYVEDAEPPRMALHFEPLDQGNSPLNEAHNISTVAYYSPFAPSPVRIDAVIDVAATKPNWRWSRELFSEGVWLRSDSKVALEIQNPTAATRTYKFGPIASARGFQIDVASTPTFDVLSGTHEIVATVEGTEVMLEIASGSSVGQGVVLHASANSISLLAPELIRAKYGANFPWEPTRLVESVFSRTSLTQEVRVFSARDEAYAVVLDPTDTNQAVVLGLLKQQTITEVRDANDFRSAIKVDTSPFFLRTRTIEINFLSSQTSPNENHKFNANKMVLTSNATSATSGSKPEITDIYGAKTTPSSIQMLSGNAIDKSIVLTVPVNTSIATALFVDGNFKQSIRNTKSTLTFVNVDLPEGPNHHLSAKLLEGDDEKNADDLRSVQYPFEKRTNDFIVTDVGPKDYGVRLDADRMEITFSRQIATPTAEQLRTNPEAYVLLERSRSGSSDGPFEKTNIANEKATLNGGKTKLVIAVPPPTAGLYRLTVTSVAIKDSFGNQLTGNNGKTGVDYIAFVGQASTNTINSDPLTAGVNRGNAPIVEYPPVIPATEPPRGFNQNDRVETRVARLYFYRDAHRVAQILNRRAQSYNRQDVTMRKQMADKSRQEAESLTTKRQISERTAVEKAKRTRELENQLSDAQRTLNYSLQQMQQLAVQPISDPKSDAAKRRDAQLTQLEIASRSSAEQVRALESKIESARDSEVNSNERWQQDQRSEELSRAEQFRLETAAAHADPDTFAEGKPTSIDAVHQVSISVIGEGILHLRGPLRGVNQVRMMIDQIDSPCGQVRVNVHSTQINGEAPDELETVANRIQTYIDQARFLTMQSGEMLRKAVLHTAATRAEEARGMYPGESQADRDQRYLVAFFGKDFVDELRAMDSEFLQTGNKLLSLHSMDVTSLSSALTMIALANNGTRMAIWQEFERLLQSDLSMAEQQFLRNSIAECTTKKCKHGCKGTCKHNQPPPVFQLTGNASFTSLRGFFDANVPHDDTITPLQREVIRLAQILKSRLVTEMELKQRVMERAVIEERIGTVENETDQLNREKAATELLRNATQETIMIRANLLPSLTLATSAIDVKTIDVYKQSTTGVLKEFKKITSLIFRENIDSDSEFPLQMLDSMIDTYRVWRTDKFAKAKSVGKSFTHLGDTPDANTKMRMELWADYKLPPMKSIDEKIYLVADPKERLALYQSVSEVIIRLNSVKFQLASGGSNPDIQDSIKTIEHFDSRFNAIQNETADLKTPTNKQAVISIADLQDALRDISKLIARQRQMTNNYDELVAARQSLLSQNSLTFDASNVDTLSLNTATKLLQEWIAFRQKVLASYPTSVPANLSAELEKTNQNFQTWYTAVSKLNAARSIAQSVRRPLDHKKFLDMLIDDLEEKYIELLEGTRAHTANIDNYLKRLTTSLDDDFNTQFYYPVFRSVRKASQNYKVEFGQTETTNVLANNRELAKVSPAATMEFDLPKRDILIKEGIDSALAIYNDVGALVNDPNLMSLAKMQSGQSTASPGAGTLGGYGAVRNVYPGLGNDTTNRLVSQNAGSGPKFESNVEKLIPDPAIYKFETGTGYEIRPVIAPDGQAVVFDFNYMYTTQVREPVRADEKHLGRIKQHYIDTDVQLSNFELREVSRYVVALKAARTAKGVPLLEDIPVVGGLWRPLPSDEKSLQQNIIMAQATIFPTLFDLMGLRWAPAVSDMDPMRLSNREYIVRNRHKFLENRIYDYSSARVDEFLRVPDPARRADLYRSQETIPQVHPNGYQGPGLDIEVSPMRNGYDPQVQSRSDLNIPGASPEGALYPSNRNNDPRNIELRGDPYRNGVPPTGAFIEDVPPMRLDSSDNRRGGTLPSPAPKTNSGWEYSRPR